MASDRDQILAGKVALVTGGSRGIGRAIAEAYARAGAKVFICGRNADHLGRAVEQVRGVGVIEGVAGDVGDPLDVERIVQATINRFGAVHVLVNNASILGPRQPLSHYPIADWSEVLRINLTGIFLMVRAVLPIMLEQRMGSIINLSSGVAKKGRARWGAYAVSKAGVEGLTQVLADEVSASGIRVNTVNPAPTRTEMRVLAYPSEDPLTLPTPDEILPVFLYLASDASAAVSGQSLEARDWLKRQD
jgi:NAD(P)-dependent dehydrogenase (short-subunit alcohol dehydrogenase family)